MTAMRRELPTGTVTFLFTDIEGSTKLLHELGAEAYADALADPARGVRRERRLRGGYARRRLLCRFPDSTRSAGGGAGGAGGVRPGADPGAHGAAHRHTAPGRGGLRRSRRAPRRPHRGLR